MIDAIKQIDVSLENYLVKKAPPLPENFKETLVKIVPWLALIFGILAIPALLAVFGLGAVATPFMAFSGARTGLFWISWIIGAAQAVLELMAFRPLKDHKKSGWELMLYSSLLGLLASLTSVSLFGLVVTVITFYLLYQIKSSYK